MITTLQSIREKYDSTEGYAKDVCGLSKEDVKGIRKNLSQMKSPYYNRQASNKGRVASTKLKLSSSLEMSWI